MHSNRPSGRHAAGRSHCLRTDGLGLGSTSAFFTGVPCSSTSRPLILAHRSRVSVTERGIFGSYFKIQNLADLPRTVVDEDQPRLVRREGFHREGRAGADRLEPGDVPRDVALLRVDGVTLGVDERDLDRVAALEKRSHRKEASPAGTSISFTALDEFAVIKYCW